MPYYRAGDYYRMKGDYYRKKGDALALLPDWMPGAGAIQQLYRAATSGAKAAANVPGLTTIAAAKNLFQGSQGKITRATGGGGRMYRRINPLNPKALRRALRRAKGFERFARRVMHFTHRRPGQTRFKFPKRRKRT